MDFAEQNRLAISFAESLAAALQVPSESIVILTREAQTEPEMPAEIRFILAISPEQLRAAYHQLTSTLP